MELQDRLDAMIGFGWWKRYIAAAFWSNVSTPLNLTITVLTALTTAQVTSENLFSHAVVTRISVATLILTTLNTFFRPHHQVTELVKSVGQWTRFGNRFEEIVLSAALPHEERLASYQALHRDINAYRMEQAENLDVNVLTDLMHMVARLTVLRSRERWLRGGGSGGRNIDIEAPSL